MNPELLSGGAGLGLSLIFSYVPGLKEAYAKLGSTAKSLIMAAMVIVAAIISAAWSCSSPDSKEALKACLADGGWRTYAQSILSALVANQSVHRITPKPKPKSKPRRKRAKIAVPKTDA